MSLGAAYGIAVTGTMAITSVLFYVVARGLVNWSLAHVLAHTGLPHDRHDAVRGELIKIESGGWVPIAIAAVRVTLMSTWKKGRHLLNHALHSGALPLDLFLGDVARRKPVRVQRHRVFMTSSNDGVPVVLLHHLKHNKVLHEQVILMSVVTRDIPEVAAPDRVTWRSSSRAFIASQRVTAFMESPNVPEILQWAGESGIKAKPNDTTSIWVVRESSSPTANENPAPAARRRRRAPPHGPVAQKAVCGHVGTRDRHGVSSGFRRTGWWSWAQWNSDRYQVPDTSPENRIKKRKEKAHQCGAVCPFQINLLRIIWHLAPGTWPLPVHPPPNPPNALSPSVQIRSTFRLRLDERAFARGRRSLRR